MTTILLPEGAVSSVALLHPPVRRSLLSAASMWVPPDPSWTSVLDAAAGAHGVEVGNAFRAQHAAGPLTVDAHLQTAAEYHALWLAFYGQLKHDELDPPLPHPPCPRDWYTRILASDYVGPAAENAAYGSALTVEYAFTMWTSQGPGEGHYDNLVNDGWTTTGYAVGVRDDGLRFHVQEFGTGGHAPKLTVTAVRPTSGKVGDPVEIVGTGFDALTVVSFGGVHASSSHWTEKSYPTTVPAGAVTGPVMVTTALELVTGPVFTVGSSPPPPPPPPPPDTKPRPGEKWRNKTNANVVTVASVTSALVTYRNKRGQLGSLTAKVFVKRYEKVPA